MNLHFTSNIVLFQVFLLFVVNILKHFFIDDAYCAVIK